MAVLNELIEEGDPGFFAPPAFHESVGVSYHDKCVAGSGQEDIESLWRSHKSNVGGLVATGERGDNNIALFALVIICDCQHSPKTWQAIAENRSQLFLRRGQHLPTVDIRMGRLKSCALARESKPARTRSNESRSFRTGSFSLLSWSRRRCSWPRYGVRTTN